MCEQFFFFFQAEDGIRDVAVTGVQTCALPMAPKENTRSPHNRPEAWSQKHIHRLIVNSATYRQSSRITPDLYAKDPYNRLLARGPRLRVEGEIVRDIALAASGLLNPRIGGP